MDTASQATPVRRLFARDAEGRILFVPGHPWSRKAHVVPSPIERGRIERRLEFYLHFWLGAGFGLLVAIAFGELSPWTGVALGALSILHWIWLLRRSTRGLERVPYEPPPR